MQGNLPLAWFAFSLKKDLVLWHSSENISFLIGSTSVKLSSEERQKKYLDISSLFCQNKHARLLLSLNSSSEVSEQGNFKCKRSSGKELLVYWRGCVKELVPLSQEAQQNWSPQFHFNYFFPLCLCTVSIMGNVRAYSLLLPCDEICILHCCKIMTSVGKTCVDGGCVCVWFFL